MGLTLRDENGRYLPGTGGGPGRPKNSRPRLISALREALDEDETLERLRRVAIDRLEAGDPSFWKMLLDRVWPTKVEISGDSAGPIEFRWRDSERERLLSEPIGEPQVEPSPVAVCARCGRRIESRFLRSKTRKAQEDEIRSASVLEGAEGDDALEISQPMPSAQYVIWTALPARIPKEDRNPACRPPTNLFRITRTMSGPGLTMTRNVIPTTTRICSSTIESCGGVECTPFRRRVNRPARCARVRWFRFTREDRCCLGLPSLSARWIPRRRIHPER